MIHKAWSSIEEVPYIFQGHLSHFKVTRLKRLSILTHIGRFRTVTPVGIHQWLRNDAQSLEQHRRVPYCFSCDQAAPWMVQSVCLTVCPSVCLSVTTFWLCSHPTKWYRKLEVAWKRCLLFFKVIHQISRSHGTKNRRFWTELSVSGL